MTLPTIEQAQEFLRVINVGREAIGLERLEKLEFDDAEPGEPHACLSATNLFADAGLWVGAAQVKRHGQPFTDEQATLATALGEEVRTDARCGDYFVIPDPIRVVTDPFDSEEEGLYERLREAGVVW